MTLVDSNVLLNVFSESEPWVAWSKQQLERAARRGPVFINDVIYAEISVQFRSFESLDAVLKEILIDVAPTPVRHYFWPGRHSGNIAAQAACEPACCPISLLVLMPQFRTSRLLLATPAAIAIIFRLCN